MTTYTIVINVLAHPFDDEVVQLQIHTFEDLMLAAAFFNNCALDSCVREVEVLIDGKGGTNLTIPEKQLREQFMVAANTSIASNI